MPFVVCHAVPSFQRMIDCVMLGIPFVRCYLNNLLIFSPHEEDPREVLQDHPATPAGSGFSRQPSKVYLLQILGGVPGAHDHGIQNFSVAPPHRRSRQFPCSGRRPATSTFHRCGEFLSEFSATDGQHLPSSDRPLQEGCAVRVGAPGSRPLFRTSSRHWLGLTASPTTNSVHLYA